MPASLLTDMNSNSGGLEDQRALQIALELSMLGISSEDESRRHIAEQLDSEKDKKSANMTECVPVPSSEHVAEIVGRQGCKIKALRAKTNTYIKTPVRGEEPVFVVTGRREDVALAKHEILSAAEHFSQIRATRRNNQQGGTPSPPGSIAQGPPSPNTPGQVTIQVRVPYRVVGLVVGPKGATIKRIQQQTNTYIVTPSRDKEPVFEVTGLPEKVEKARNEIESHIAMRTGGALENGANDVDDFHSNGVDSGFHELSNDYLTMYKAPSSTSAFSTYNGQSSHSNNHIDSNNIFTFPPTNGHPAKISVSGLTNGFTTTNGFYDNDEGIASPTFDQMIVPPPASVWSDLGDQHSNVSMFGGTQPTATLPQRSSSLNENAITTSRLSPTLTDSTNGVHDHPSVRRMRSDPLSGGMVYHNGFHSAVSSGSSSTSPTESLGSRIGRTCCVCTKHDIVAALVPCGHNMFCLDCANLVLSQPESERQCPICHQLPTQAIRIFS
ncbi:unnamed protein product [Owenia fusiformis]|uniref:Uncharacterized protein n=1 Tax=Owenia fusiformis TaxID=6347 RepID=A0A8J1TX02_OWEFU|nr:unnamed protein product [Owenia fusiformis]